MEEAQKFHIHGTESRTEIKERPHLIRFWCQAYKITWISEEVLPQAILASHMQVSVHIKRCDPTAVCQWEQPQPCFAQSLQDTAISRYCFTLAAVLAPLFQQGRLQNANSEIVKSSSCRGGFTTMPRGRRKTQQQFHTGCNYLWAQHNRETLFFFSPL